MKTARKFWRLLADYERLATDEGVALREINLEALARLQSQKADISEAVLALAADSGLTLPVDRFQRLLAQQEENLAIAQEQIARMSCERQDLTNASQRLTHVGRAYQQEAGSATAFRAKV